MAFHGQFFQSWLIGVAVYLYAEGKAMLWLI
jgi:hypothetical protein